MPLSLGFHNPVSREILEGFLSNLEVILPDIDISRLEIVKITKLDLHSPQEQHEENLNYFSFFTLLSKEIQHAVFVEVNKLDDMENQLVESWIQTLLMEGEKLTGIEAKAKRKAFLEPRYIDQRNAVQELKHKKEMVDAVVDILSKKAIALNVLLAREKAEMMSGLRN